MNLELNKDFGFLRAGVLGLGKERSGNKSSEREGARTVFSSIDAFMTTTLPSGHLTPNVLFRGRPQQPAPDSRPGYPQILSRTTRAYSGS